MFIVKSISPTCIELGNTVHKVMTCNYILVYYHKIRPYGNFPDWKIIHPS